MRRINDESLALIQRWEGLHLSTYECEAGVDTIGYGHTKTARPGQVITVAEANRLLLEDLAEFERAISDMVRVPLTDGQFGALVSWAFNVGEGAARKSTLIRKLNNLDYDAVPAELMRWNKVGKRVVPGLTNRRAAEAGLWARGSHVASASVAPAPAATSVSDVVRDTGTGKAAVGVGAAGIVATIAQAAPAIESLGSLGPIVGIALILAASALFVLWRRGRI
jgi:lysozyme